eukprot:2523185-Pyramimonas_sp.AAC.1
MRASPGRASPNLFCNTEAPCSPNATALLPASFALSARAGRRSGCPSSLPFCGASWSGVGPPVDE